MKQDQKKILFIKAKVEEKIGGKNEEAKRQNPGVKIVYEFPDTTSKNRLISWLRENQNGDYIHILDIIRIRGEK